MREIEKPIWDVVHPENCEFKIDSFNRQLSDPSLKYCMKCLRHYFKNKFRAIVGGGAVPG